MASLAPYEIDQQGDQGAFGGLPVVVAPACRAVLPDVEPVDLELECGIRCEIPSKTHAERALVEAELVGRVGGVTRQHLGLPGRGGSRHGRQRRGHVGSGQGGLLRLHPAGEGVIGDRVPAPCGAGVGPVGIQRAPGNVQPAAFRHEGPGAAVILGCERQVAGCAAGPEPVAQRCDRFPHSGQGRLPEVVDALAQRLVFRALIQAHPGVHVAEFQQQPARFPRQPERQDAIRFRRPVGSAAVGGAGAYRAGGGTQAPRRTAGIPSLLHVQAIDGHDRREGIEIGGRARPGECIADIAALGIQEHVRADPAHAEAGIRPWPVADIGLLDRFAGERTLGPRQQDALRGGLPAAAVVPVDLRAEPGVRRGAEVCRSAFLRGAADQSPMRGTGLVDHTHGAEAAEGDIVFRGLLGLEGHAWAQGERQCDKGDSAYRPCSGTRRCLRPLRLRESGCSGDQDGLRARKS